MIGPENTMFKLAYLLLIALVGSSAAASEGAILGDDAASCRTGKPAVLVRVTGIKKPTGRIKIGVYESGRFLQKRGTVSKDTIPVRSGGPLDICLSVPGPGRYAVAIHHDLNGNGDKDFNDGAGFSNNPALSLAKLKPSFAATAIQVGAAPRRVPVVLQYRKGLSIGPVIG
jgi:uncharacterized protein (DUF2141 family)